MTTRPRPRDKAVRALVGECLQRLDPHDTATVLRVLPELGKAVQAEADRLGEIIPSDPLGNPLPTGEDARLLWASTQRQADEISTVAAALRAAVAS